MIANRFAVHAASRPLGVVLRMTIAVVACCVAVEAAAQVIVDSDGFEVVAAPYYDTTFGPGGPGTGSGQLEGQIPDTFNKTWLRTEGAGTSTANVQDSVVKSGQQAVRVDKAANDDALWAVPVNGYPATDCLCIRWDMRVDGPFGDVNDGDFGPFFGVEAYDDDATSIGLLGALGVDSTTGSVLYVMDDPRQYGDTGATVAFDEWYNFQIKLDYSSHTYSVFLDNALLLTDGFVDQSRVAGGLNQFTDANIAARAEGVGALQLLTGFAYFDNFIVHEGQCIPEPGTLALAILAGLAVFGSARAGMK